MPHSIVNVEPGLELQVAKPPARMVSIVLRDNTNAWVLGCELNDGSVFTHTAMIPMPPLALPAHFFSERRPRDSITFLPQSFHQVELE